MTRKIAILGPEYSYCHILATKTFPFEEYVFCQNINEIFEKVSHNKVEEGLAPIENMLYGSVRESLMALKSYKVKINHSFDLPIHHCLAAQSSDFKKIVSHPQALGQCVKFISESGKPTQEESSTSKAMELASENKEYAAIGSVQAAKKFNLQILNENIEDNHNNHTRFILISKKERENITGKNIRTSLMIHPHKDKPGLLFEILSVFKIEEINLTKIESIPTGNKIGEYNFFIEIVGSTKDRNVENALNFLGSLHDIFNFGSYNLELVGS